MGSKYCTSPEMLLASKQQHLWSARGTLRKSDLGYKYRVHYGISGQDETRIKIGSNPEIPRPSFFDMLVFKYRLYQNDQDEEEIQKIYTV